MLGLLGDLAKWPRRLALAAALTLLPASAFAGPPKLLVTIAQIGEPLGRILGDCAEVESLLGPGVDPHLYRLTRSDTAKALQADGIVANGLNLEAQMRTLFERLAKAKPVIFAGELLDEAQIMRPAGASPDPHIWMDPALWRQVLERTADRVASDWPECAPAIAKGAPPVLAEIEAVERYVAGELAKIPESARVLITAHDAFGYFGRRYGFEVRGVQGLSTESEAGVAHIRDLARLIADKRIQAVFAETSTADRAVEAVLEGAAALGAKAVKGPALFSDAMGPPGTYEGRYVGMMDHNATAIAAALGGKPPAKGMHGQLSRALNIEG